jgi:hypothetical protein
LKKKVRILRASLPSSTVAGYERSPSPRYGEKVARSAG